jgi:hypothetical protein
MDEAIGQRRWPCAVLLLRVTLGVLFLEHPYWKFVVLDGGIDRWWGNLATNG